MRHFLAASLIVTALASPVRGEGIYIECVNVRDSRQKDSWTLYPDIMRFTYGRDPLEHSGEILVWNEAVVGWARAQENSWFVMTYVLNVDSLQLRKVDINDWRVIETFFRCYRPL